jgi:hypothetical protein
MPALLHVMYKMKRERRRYTLRAIVPASSLKKIIMTMVMMMILRNNHRIMNPSLLCYPTQFMQLR